MKTNDELWRTCRKCQYMMSMDAETCPDCGTKVIQQGRSAKPIIGGIVAILIIGAGFVLAFPEHVPVSIPENPASEMAQAIRSDIVTGEFPAETTEQVQTLMEFE